MSESPVPAIEANHLSMYYGRKQVLKQVDLTVSGGRVLALLGPNGAGKSTTVDVLAGMRTCSGGRVQVLGDDPANADEGWRSRIGVVRQSWRDHQRWRVGDLLQHLGSYYEPYSSPQRKKPLDSTELLSMVGLSGAARQRVWTLSGGQRRRLDVAIGLVGNPELLFLDEPTVGFDPVARRDFHQLIKDLYSETLVTILLTTHDLKEAQALSTDVAVMISGKIFLRVGMSSLRRTGMFKDEVIYRTAGEEIVSKTDPGHTVEFVRSLLNQKDFSVDDLEVRHTRLEDVYLELMRMSGTTAGN